MTLIINESNYKEAVRERLQRVDPVDGFPEHGCCPRKFPYGSVPHTIRATQLLDPIPRTDWPRLIEEGLGSELGDLTLNHLPPHDQGRTNYCWAHGSITALEHLRVWEGQQPVTLSAESIAVPLTGGRNRGGTPDEAVLQMANYGACPQEYWPLNSLDIRDAKPGWDEERNKYRLLRWADVVGFEMQMTFALLRIPVAIGLGWWGHLVCQLDPVLFEDGTFGIGCLNSWGADYGVNGYFVLTERRGTADLGAFAPLSATFLANYSRRDLQAFLSP
jgi:hypothetical protein